jgi:SPP1 gp7 family putative phage head morphogenesis protein
MSRDLLTSTARINRQLDKLPERVTRELAKVYRLAEIDVRNEIARLYTLYQVEGELTRSQAAQFIRQSRIKEEIERVMRPYLLQSRDIIEQGALFGFDTSHLQHAWAIEQAVGVSMGFGAVSDTAVRAAVGLGGTFEELRGILSTREIARHQDIMERAFRKYERDTVRKIGQELGRGIIQGESIPKLNRRLRDKAIVQSYHSAERIARTETLRALSIGARVSYEQAGDFGVTVEQTWDATLDDRTRPDHATMDGRVKNNETGLFENTPWGQPTPGPHETDIAEQDINCRCQIGGNVGNISPRVRRIRDEGIRPYQTFTQWGTGKGITANRYGQKYNF